MKIQLTITVDVNDLIFALLHRMDNSDFIEYDRMGAYEAVRENDFLMKNLVRICKNSMRNLVEHELDEYDTLINFAQQVDKKCQNLKDLRTITSIK